MAALAFTAPVLPGITHDDLKRFAQEATGARRNTHNASRQPSGGSGITTELAWLQQTPQGDMAVIYIEAADLGHVFQGLATSPEPCRVRSPMWSVQAREGSLTWAISA